MAKSYFNFKVSKKVTKVFELKNRSPTCMVCTSDSSSSQRSKYWLEPIRGDQGESIQGCLSCLAVFSPEVLSYLISRTFCSSQSLNPIVLELRLCNSKLLLVVQQMERLISI